MRNDWRLARLRSFTQLLNIHFLRYIASIDLPVGCWAKGAPGEYSIDLLCADKYIFSGNVNI